MKINKQGHYTAIGRRKTSTARVRLIPGTGKMLINKKDNLEYFKKKLLVMDLEQPLVKTDMLGKFDIFVNVSGGGLSGQAGATRLGITRALILYNQDLKPILKEAGFTTRDSRMKERKKYGMAGARKRYQFSKR
ncbi:MAG: 30S ribosomal protein S9 [Candidatus Cloacimonadota bacterium]|nr:MAG: 30S ribosomal protein S9 [Candidatus Cloacimonadota bacterium]PIE79470.1 MAG: 30S ribosomal protein S9 [Candidatus Delongbacteria bacterium]